MDQLILIYNSHKIICSIKILIVILLIVTLIAIL